MNLSGPLRRVWASLHEPPAVTGVIVAYYGVLAVLGVMGLATEAPAPPMIRYVSTAAWVACIVSGVVGAPSAWRGVWWLERGAAFAGIVASAMIALLMVRLYRLTVTSEHDVTLMLGLAAGLASALALFTTRYMRVRRTPWQPGKEPPRAREHAARCAAEA